MVVRSYDNVMTVQAVKSRLTATRCELFRFHTVSHIPPCCSERKQLMPLLLPSCNKKATIFVHLFRLFVKFCKLILRKLAPRYASPKRAHPPAPVVIR